MPCTEYAVRVKTYIEMLFCDANTFCDVNKLLCSFFRENSRLLLIIVIVTLSFATLHEQWIQQWQLSNSDSAVMWLEVWDRWLSWQLSNSDSAVMW